MSFTAATVTTLLKTYYTKSDLYALCVRMHQRQTEIAYRLGRGDIVREMVDFFKRREGIPYLGKVAENMKEQRSADEDPPALFPPLVYPENYPIFGFPRLTKMNVTQVLIEFQQLGVLRFTPLEFAVLLIRAGIPNGAAGLRETPMSSRLRNIGQYAQRRSLLDDSDNLLIHLFRIYNRFVNDEPSEGDPQYPKQAMNLLPTYPFIPEDANPLVAKTNMVERVGGEAEFALLCFWLGVAPSNFSGENLNSQIRSLIEHYQRRQSLHHLIRVYNAQAADVDPRTTQGVSINPLAGLHYHITENYDMPTLRSIGIQIGVDTEDLSAVTFSEHVQELILYLQRRQSVEKLLEAVNYKL